MSGLGQLVTSGPLILALPVAAAAGAVTFLSPCCLPLVPGYLSFVTGMAGASGSAATLDRSEGSDLGSAPGDAGTSDGSSGMDGAGVAVATRRVAAVDPRPPRGRVVVGTLLFVLGFSLVFVAWGAALGGLGHLVIGHTRLLTRIIGVLTIVLGLLFAGAFDRFTFAGRIVRPSSRPKAGLAGAPLLGVMFGLGWSPCIGPTLTAVLALSASSGTASRGAILAFVYALGLGIPFLLVSLGLQTAMRALSFFRRHARLVTRIGGAMLVCVGLLEVTGAWLHFMAWLQAHWLSTYQPPI
jgi:cytochrome c-type biogenesis protein